MDPKSWIVKIGEKFEELQIGTSNLNNILTETSCVVLEGLRGVSILGGGVY